MRRYRIRSLRSAMRSRGTWQAHLRDGLARTGAVAVLTAVLLEGRNASAQVDVNPPLPNVLLLVDTSGSMEYNIDGSKVACSHVDAKLTGEPTATTTSDKSRWVQLVEVLTGDISGYSCWTQDRRTDAFRSEYQLGSSAPPDYNYVVPHHRILYSDPDVAAPCTVGPGDADATNAFAWGSTPFRYHVWNATNPSDPSKACKPPTQSKTGLLDTFGNLARFGLMTFDTQTNQGTGLPAGGTSKVPDYPSGVAGTWSYFLDWWSDLVCGTTNSSCAFGRPDGCKLLSPLEVGARNAAAPPWEGRMMSFGPPSALLSDVTTNKDRIKQVLLAARPFGATPINGMLADARDFLTADTSTDPNAGSGKTCGTDPEVCYGPKNDPFVKGKCRRNFIILLTDGEPNLDLRPSCQPRDSTPADSKGVCPYEKKPSEILEALAQLDNPIQTFVIGFALSTPSLDGGPTTVDCSTLTAASRECGPGMDSRLSACCTLHQLAAAGNPDPDKTTAQAHFAVNASELRSALSDILSQIASVSTSRTVPVYGSAAGTVAHGGSYTFYSSFKVAAGSMWRGSLTRQRTTCDLVSRTSGGATTTTNEPVTQQVDKEKGDDFAYNVNTKTDHPRHYYTVIAAEDTGGVINSDASIRPRVTSNDDGAGVRTGDQVDGSDEVFLGKIKAKAMRVTQAACKDYGTSAGDEVCAQQIMKWEIGVSNGTLPNRVGNVLGDIYHATPVLVGPPGENLRDESYTAYATAHAARPVVLYAATNDGQLHAFKVASVDPADSFKVDTATQNELWSFFPPAVLPSLVRQYPNAHQTLLDSSPVVRDVVFSRTQQTATSGGAASDWHTVLVEGFGAGGPGYFALDVTESGMDKGGPKFMWQLTTDSDGKRLFGEYGGVPAIATLYFKHGNDTDAREHAVAILPGGSTGDVKTSCRLTKPESTLVDPDYPPRDLVQVCAAHPAKTVTIVLLETGEILRTFSSNLYAYMTGQPVIYPAQTGTVSDRAFIGDSEGMLWRIDLSSTDPKNWTIGLWFDAYNKIIAPVDAGTAAKGQPIATVPVLSVDDSGNLTVAFATGDQESFTYAGGVKNYLYSLEEDASSKSKLQWYQSYLDGERVSGPMQIYSGVLYYTTLRPQPAVTGEQACKAGSSSLCAVDYIKPKGTKTSGQGGAEALPGETKEDPLRQCKNLGDTVAFGAAITQTPTCTVQETYTDPYLGLPNHASLRSGVNGGGSKVVVNGSSVATGTTQTAIDLPAPARTTRLDSWATLIEN